MINETDFFIDEYNKLEKTELIMKQDHKNKIKSALQKLLCEKKDENIEYRY